MTRSKLILLPVLGLSLALSGLPGGQSLPSGDLSAKVLPSVVSLDIRLPDGRTVSGVGFLTLQDGVLATAWSLVGKALGVVARFPNGEEFECSGVVDKDPKRGVALVRIRAFGRPVLKMDPAEPAPGTPVVVAAVKEGAFGLLAAAIGEAAVIDGVRLVRLSGDIPLEAVGGPVVDAAGNVVGLVEARDVDGRPETFLMPAALLLGLDTSLATQPWGRADAPAEKAAAKPALSNDEIDVRLGEALIALIDNSVALTHAQVVTQGFGFRGGVPQLLYNMQQGLESAMMKLGEATTDDELRGKLIKPILQIMVNQRAASESYIKAVVMGQQANTWGAQSQDLRKRSDTLSQAVAGQQASIRADLASLEASSDKIREYLPAELRYTFGLAERPSTFRLGCVVFPRNPFYLLVVYLDGLGYKLGFRAGDTVRSAGGREFSPKDSFEDLKMIIQENLGKTLQVVVDRDGKRKTLPVKVPKAIPGEYLYGR